MTVATEMHGWILDAHRARAREDRSPDRCRSGLSTRHLSEAVFHLKDARLWAAAFPKEAEKFAFAIAKDSTADPDDRRVAILYLGQMMESGNPAAETLLHAIARAGTDSIASSAVWTLADRDSEGRYLELYRDQARRGDYLSLMVLGDWVDAGSRRVLEELLARGDVHRSSIEMCLQRITLLECADWFDRIAPILDSRIGAASNWFDWALRVSRRRGHPGIVPRLRTRLRQVEEELLQVHANWKYRTDSFEDVFVKWFEVAQLDRYFDEALVAYSELGGELTELEARRLEMLGYRVDPLRRLTELMQDLRKVRPVER